MISKLRQWIIRTDSFLNRIRKPLNLVLFAGLLIFIGSQNFRIGDTSLGAFLREAGVVGIFGLGLWISKATQRPFKLIVLFWLYIFGLTFEILTEDRWEYHYVVLLIRDDISLTFPLGWSGLCMAATAGSEFLYKRIRQVKKVDLLDNMLYRLDVIVWIILGGTLESIFHALGMIYKYLNSYPLGMSPFGPPWVILIAYGFFPGLILSMLVRNLEHEAVDY